MALDSGDTKLVVTYTGDEADHTVRMLLHGETLRIRLRDTLWDTNPLQQHSRMYEVTLIDPCFNAEIQFPSDKVYNVDSLEFIDLKPFTDVDALYSHLPVPVSSLCGDVTV